MTFQNRSEAGQILAEKLKVAKLPKNLIVLAIPRGGVVIGKKIAEILDCPLDVIVTKKISAPANPELAIGAVGPFEASTELSRTSYAQGEPVIDEAMAAKVGAGEQYLKKQIADVKKEVARRESYFREGKPPFNLKNKQVIITDDGVATGATMAAAVEIVRQQEPKKIIVAVPVIAQDTLAKIGSLADEVIYLQAPKLFFAVGQFYQDFKQIEDKEVIEILRN